MIMTIHAEVTSIEKDDMLGYARIEFPVGHHAPVQGTASGCTSARQALLDSVGAAFDSLAKKQGS